MKKVQKFKTNERQQISLSSTSKISAKGGLRLRSTLMREQKKLQIVHNNIESSIKTIGMLDESQIVMASKLIQLNVEKSTFKPTNVRIRNIQLGK